MSPIPSAHGADAGSVRDCTANQTQSQDARESVMLHQLCGHCKRFVDGWDFLKLVPEDIEDIYDVQVESPASTHYSTVAQLLQARDTCHMCAMVLSILDYPNLDHNETVEIRICKDKWEKPPGYLPLILCLGGLKYVQYRWASMYLKCFDGSSSHEFDAPEQKQSIPSQPTANLDQINTWLNACIRTHESCSSCSSGLSASSQRPTRLLELTSDGVGLRCDTSTIRDLQYLTLSHVWGDAPHRLRLTLSRLEEFQVAIPWSELPAIFVEALRIVRHTGFRYLWVDVLCIIQDSPSDWEVESASMTSVYSNAICSIAFLFPPGRDLIKTREDPRTMSPCVIRKATKTSEGIYIIASAGRYVSGPAAPTEPEIFTSRFNYHEWPISQRAWTFQEHLLCPRTILFGHQTLMWECVEEFCDELAGSWLPKTETRLYNRSDGYESRKITQKSHLLASHVAHRRDTSNSFADYEHVLEYFRNWKDLVWEYRARDLTVPSDRPVAFAGVARAFQAGAPITYLAGIWAESFPEGLLWYISAKYYWDKDGNILPISKSIREHGSKKAPSWSWLSSHLYLDHPLRYFDRYEYWRPNSHDGEFQASDLLFLAQLSYFQWSGWPVNTMPPTAYHDFSGLQITLQLPTFEETRIESHDPYDANCVCLKEKLASFYVRPPECAEHAWTALRCDDIEYHTQPPERVLLALLVETRVPYCPQSILGGLALMPGEEEGTWERIGYWEAQIYLPVDEALDNKQTGHRYVHTSREWQRSDPSVFLRLEGVKMESLTLV